MAIKLPLAEVLLAVINARARCEETAFRSLPSKQALVHKTTFTPQNKKEKRDSPKKDLVSNPLCDSFTAFPSLSFSAGGQRTITGQEE